MAETNATLTDIQLLADHLSWHVKENHEDVWQVFCCLHGQTRRDRLMQITEALIGQLTKEMKKE